MQQWDDNNCMPKSSEYFVVLAFSFLNLGPSRHGAALLGSVVF
jgi:hypothetical protein